jgi:hypothetical protein
MREKGVVVLGLHRKGYIFAIELRLKMDFFSKNELGVSGFF